MITYWRETPSGLLVQERTEVREMKGPSQETHDRLMGISRGSCEAPCPMPTMKARPFGNLDPDGSLMRCYCDDTEPREVQC